MVTKSKHASGEAAKRKLPARPRPLADMPAAKAARPRARPVDRRWEIDNWDQRLGFLMHDVSRLRRTVFDEFMKPLGVTRSQWWVLANLARHDGMIQSDLAHVLELGKAALGGLLDRLEAMDLILRRPDEIDRRAKRVFVSTKGSQLIAQMRPHSHEMSERILEGLDRNSRQALVQLLLAVKHNLVAIKSEYGHRAADDSGA